MNVAKPAVRLTLVPAGVELLDAIVRLATAEGWINASGYVEAVELRVAADGGDKVTELVGRFNLLSLAGPRGGPFAATLARFSDAGPQVFGGELVRARSAGVSVTLIAATRETTPAAGAGVGSPATWATAAAASAARTARDDERADDPVPEAGDWVQHFAFGLCEVLTSEGDRLRIRDVEGARRVREVALTMLRVTGPTESDGKRLFHLVRRGSP